MFNKSGTTVQLMAMWSYASANLNSRAPDLLRMARELGGWRRLCVRVPQSALQATIDECLSEAQSRHSGIAQLR